MTQVGRGSLVITVTAPKGSLTATTERLTITAVDPFGLPADGITVSPAATDNDDGSFTFARATNGLGDTNFTVIASKSGYPSVSTIVTVPQQDATVLAPPALNVTGVTITGTTVSVAYTYTGTLTYTKNGTDAGTVYQPLVVTRPSSGSADDSYILVVTGADSSTIQYAFTAAAQPASGTAATDLPSCEALANAMHGVLVAKGWMT